MCSVCPPIHKTLFLRKLQLTRSPQKACCRKGQLRRSTPWLQKARSQAENVALALCVKYRTMIMTTAPKVQPVPGEEAAHWPRSFCSMNQESPPEPGGIYLHEIFIVYHYTLVFLDCLIGRLHHMTSNNLHFGCCSPEQPIGCWTIDHSCSSESQIFSNRNRTRNCCLWSFHCCITGRSKGTFDLGHLKEFGV